MPLINTDICRSMLRYLILEQKNWRRVKDRGFPVTNEISVRRSIQNLCGASGNDVCGRKDSILFVSGKVVECLVTVYKRSVVAVYERKEVVVVISVCPAGWRNWFVFGLLYPRLAVKHRSKSVDFSLYRKSTAAMPYDYTA
ncbi:hypothetical protein TNCV_4481851 [Trichonephila clavipes]|nr:hypothetical protein TNCV_4481851 [Trichonephila clavipes]